MAAAKCPSISQLTLSRLRAGKTRNIPAYNETKSLHNT